jgi:hypothetical protein
MLSRALVIGVERTAFGHGVFADLPGVATDVRRISDLLAERGFAVSAPGQTAPTVSEVTALLAAFVDGTPSGDLAVIYMAGHGYQAADDNGDEGKQDDRWDECFVCGDSPIRDDWFRDALWPRARSGARFVVIVDACHARSMVLGMRERSLARVPPITRSGVLRFHRLVLASCRDEQTTREVANADGSEGVITSQMLSVVTDEPMITYRDLWPRVTAMVAANYPGSGLEQPQATYQGPDDSLLATQALVP